MQEKRKMTTQVVKSDGPQEVMEMPPDTSEEVAELMRRVAALEDSDSA